MAIGIRSLTALQFRQMLRTQFKDRLVGNIVGVISFWIFECILYFIFKEKGVAVPPLAVVIISLSFMVTDIIFKLIYVHDNTVMDAYLKTRPVSQQKWDRFLTLSQFWKVENLVTPLLLAPIVFLYLSFVGALVLFFSIYLISVFNGFLVMLIKHRGHYQSEKMVKAIIIHTDKSSKGHHIFGIQFRSIIRSKRLRNSSIYLLALLYFQCVCYSFNPDGRMGVPFMAMWLFLSSMMLPQYGLAVESNFFSGIWTRPVPLWRLLRDKYLMGILTGTSGALLCLPLCLWNDMSVLTLFSLLLFLTGFVNLITLYDAFNSIPLDLFGKTFGNSQGRNFKFSQMLTVLGVMAACYLSFTYLSGWLSQVILSVLGLAGFYWHRPFFKWCERRFEKKKYEYMTKYSCK